MNHDTLESSLKALQAQFHSLDKTDPQVRQLLVELDADIRDLLGPGENHTSGVDLAEQARDLSARFAVRHPQLEPILRDLGNLLSNMGI